MQGESDATGAWAPETGTIVLDNLGCRYRDDLPRVLCNVSASLTSGSNVGVVGSGVEIKRHRRNAVPHWSMGTQVGRTGSGKSSLVLALARLNCVDAGRVLIDGVDVASLPLAALRRALVLVPQEPHLFRGTLRFNLDPWQEHSDEALRETLKMLGLDTNLDTSISENGDNLSAGQRQLLCVCRALLVSRPVWKSNFGRPTIGATFSSRPCRLDNLTHWLISTQVAAHHLRGRSDCVGRPRNGRGHTKCFKDRAAI